MSVSMDSRDKKPTAKQADNSNPDRIEDRGVVNKNREEKKAEKARKKALAKEKKEKESSKSPAQQPSSSRPAPTADSQDSSQLKKSTMTQGRGRATGGKTVTFVDQSQPLRETWFNSTVTSTPSTGESDERPIIDSAIVDFVAELADPQSDSLDQGFPKFFLAIRKALQDRFAESTVTRSALLSFLDVHAQYVLNSTAAPVYFSSVAKLLRYIVEKLDVTIEKKDLFENFESAVKEHSTLAVDAICGYLKKTINKTDNILLYGYSYCVIESVERIIEDLEMKETVTIIDSQPAWIGRACLRRLLSKGVPCNYALLHSATHFMESSAKVLVGAEAILTNGALLAPAGTAEICLLAKESNVPVLVCCESYRFLDLILADSFHTNKFHPCDNSLKKALPPDVEYLAPAFEVVPGDLVSGVVTELGLVPAVSVPNMMRKQQFWMYEAYSSDCR